MTYQEAIGFLYDLRWFGAKLGLSNTLRLAELAGNPQNKLRFIHVAGTNGKGSTCAMLESIYRAAGLRVGLFTSPHLVAFGERIQVNRLPIRKNDVVRLVAELRSLLAKGWPDQPVQHCNTPPLHHSITPPSPSEHPTFFEVVTVMALRYFVEQRCDLVIWETGLGGRLDATNIVTPLASVITNVQFDHQEWLGETLESIATEKAGIIKLFVPVVTAADEPEALAVIERAASHQLAPLTIVTEADLDSPPLPGLQLSLLGRHQRMNAALAVAAVRVLSQQLPITEQEIRDGLGSVSWPGRLQLLTRPSGQKILLDGAHNVAGARTLAEAMRETFSSVQPALVLGVLADKDRAGMCEILAPMANRIWVVPVSSPRSAKPEDLRGVCGEANRAAEIFLCGSLAEALKQAAAEPFLVIAGSLYLVGEALELLDARKVPGINERAMNEWSPLTPQKW